MKRHAWKACIRQKRIASSNLAHSAKTVCYITARCFFIFRILKNHQWLKRKKNGKQYAASRLLSLLWRLSPSKIHTYTCHHPQPRLLYGREVVVAVARDVVGLYIYAIFPVVPHHLAVHFRVRMIAVHPLLPSYAPRCRRLLQILWSKPNTALWRRYSNAYSDFSISVSVSWFWLM